MSSEPIKSSGAAASWLQLMETGVFDDCYPHRLNACFHYLSEDQLTFTLKDFIQKAAYVFSYLSFDADKDSNFAAIDIFRNFDRSGTGNISLEDFLLGAIEHLYKVRRNASLLGDIADALLSIESRAIELSTLLEKGNNKNMKFAKFNSNLGAIASIIRADIKACKKTTPILNKSLLVPIFQRAVSQAIADVQSHFHLSSGRMSTLLLTITPEELSVDLTPLPIVWGLRSDGKRSDSAEKAVGKDGEGPSGGHRPSRSQSILQLGGSPEEVLAQLLSSLDENRLKSLQQGSTVSSMGNMNGMGSWEDAHLLPPGLVENMDSNKLYLLQQAFQSLNNFFTLYSNATSTSSQQTNITNNIQINNHFHYHSPSAETGGQSYGPSNPQELLAKLKGYREMLNGSQADSETNTQGGVMMDGVEYLLAEDLFDSQTTLNNLSTKCRILEMIQSDQLYSLQQKADQQSRDRELLDTNDSSNNDDSSESGTAPSFEDIISELNCMGTLLSERTTTAFALGLMLDNKYINIQPNNQVFASLYQIEQMCYEVLENVYKCQNFQFNAEKLVRELQIKDHHVKELIHKQESFTFERNDLMTLELELQILRDKLNKHAKDDNLHKLIENKNIELSKKVKDLEDQVGRLQQDLVTSRSTAMAVDGNNEAPSPNKGSSTPSAAGNKSLTSPTQQQPATAQSSKGGVSGGTNASSVDVTTLVVDAHNVNAIINSPAISDADKLRKLAEYISTVHMQSNNLMKENNKLHTSVQYYEKRLKACISDQMNLHNNIYALEDEITMYKSNITKLTRELEDHKAFKHYKDEYDKTVFSFQQEINRYKNEIAEANNNLALANKYHNDLINAERTIESLEHKLSEINIDLEKGQIAQAQLETLRDQLKQKSKEIRDMSLHIHGLETQLKEVPYLNQRFAEVSAELQDCKNKVEKVPGLLAEISRLRGSARASIKALSEQDKMLNVYKTRVKALEKETALLKHDNRALQDVENKLKEANTEVKRLMTLLAEANGTKAGGMAVVEDRKESNAGMNKKMQRYMRQSAFFATNPLSPSQQRASVITPGPPSLSSIAEDSIK